MTTERRMTVVSDVRVPMRDGVGLATDLYLPDDGRRHPCLIQRTPYDKNQPGIVNGALDVASAVRRGYAVVVQDCRGRFASEGAFVPFASEGADGADTIAWAAGQDWCDGVVGTFGRSYSGYAQWQAALHEPPALKAMAPMFSGTDPASDWFASETVFEWGFAMMWGFRQLAPDLLARAAWPVSRDDYLALVAGFDAVLTEQGPDSTVGIDAVAPFLAGWMGRNQPSTGSAPGGRQVTVPSMLVGGWFDIFLRGTLSAWASGERVGTDQALLVGPWPHGGPMSGTYPEAGFGPMASSDAIGLSGRQLDWFDRWLRGIEPSAPAPRVTWFHTGENAWRTADRWPPVHRELRYALGSGRLTAWEDAADGELTLSFDENTPVPTIGGQTFLPGLEVAANAGPRDQGELIGRADVGCFRGDELTAPVDVIGEVVVNARIRSELAAVSLMARLVEELPGGEHMLVCEGAGRSDAHGTVRVALGTASIRFAAGSRITLLLSCTSSPRFRRWVTAQPPAAPRAGEITVLTGTGSFLTLPIAE
ncbi:MAG: CocE/NonD family hydrolase [Actinomycetota bacterium]